MAEEQTDEQKLKDAYELLEETLKEITALEGADGLLTDWVVAAAIQGFDDEGHGVAGVLLVLPDGGGRTPRYRVRGLVEEALDKIREPSVHMVVHRVGEEDDDDDDGEGV